MKQFRIDGSIYLEVKIHCDFTEIDNKIRVECALEDHVVEYEYHDDERKIILIEGKLRRFGLKFLDFLSYEDRDRNHETIDLYGGFRYYSKRDPEELDLEESLLSEFKTVANELYGIPTFYVKEKIESLYSSKASVLDVFGDVTVSRSSIDGNIHIPEVKFNCDFEEIDNKISVGCFLEDHVVDEGDEGIPVVEREMNEFKDYGMRNFISFVCRYGDIDSNYEIICDLYDRFVYDSKRDPEEPNLEESLLSEFKTLVMKVYKIPVFYVKEDITSSSSSMESALDVFGDVTVSRSKKRKRKVQKRIEKNVIEFRKKLAARVARYHKYREEELRDLMAYEE